MKRYPVYKDSGIEWIGEIPDHWTSKRFKFAVSCLESGDRESGGGNQLSDGVFSVGGEHVGWFGEIFSEGKKYISEDYYAGMSKGRIKEEDVLLVKDGATIGKCAFVREIPDGKAAVNEHVFIMRANRKYDGQYIFYFIWSYVGQEQIRVQVRGSAQPGLNSLFQNYLLIPDLPLEEQRAIASYLEYKAQQIDTLIVKKERMIELLKEERAAIINQAVTKGLDPNVELKDSGIEWLGKVPKHWEVKRLKFVVNINPQRPNDIQPETGCVFIPMEAMNTDGTFNNLERKPFSELKSGFTYFAENDVIFAKITPCFENGKGALLKNLGSSMGFGSTEFHVLRAVKNKTISKYLYFLTISGLFRGLGEAFMQGVAGQKRVTNDFIQDFIIGIPPVDEQRKIALFLDHKTAQIDGQIERAKKSIKLLKEYRAALISEVVTGKIDVRG